MDEPEAWVLIGSGDTSPLWPETKAPPIVTDPLVDTLPYRDIGWEHFEKLLVRVAQRVEKLNDVRRYGKRGQRQHGLDIVGWTSDGEAQALQGKDVERFDEHDLQRALEAFRLGNRPFDPKRLILGVAVKADRSQILHTLAEATERLSIRVELYDAVRLDELLRYQPEIVMEFFGHDAAVRFCVRSGAVEVEKPESVQMRDYRARLRLSTQFVKLAGIPLPRDHMGRPVAPQVPLDEIYIELQAVEEERSQVLANAEREALLHAIQDAQPGGSTAGGFLATLRTMGEYLYRRYGQPFEFGVRPTPATPVRALDLNGRIVVLGAPGAGKSTLLAHLAHQKAEKSDRVPVLLRLRDYATQLDKDPNCDLLTFAIRQVAGSNRLLGHELQNAATAHHILWLLDGLDETRGWQTTVAQQVAQLSGEVVVTSRPISYLRAGLEAFTHFELLALSIADRDSFLRNWFTSFMKLGKKDGAWAERTLAVVTDQLNQYEHLQELARNPLLLTFMAILACEDSTKLLPDHRARFYERCVGRLLSAWETDRLPREGLSGGPVLKLGGLTGSDALRAAEMGLYQIGWDLHTAYYGVFSPQAGSSTLAPTKRFVAVSLARHLEEGIGLRVTEGQARVLSGDVLLFWQEAGVIESWNLDGEEFLSFRHLTFQEYAAARVLAGLWESDPGRAWHDCVGRLLHHYAWQEPLLLMAGILGNDGGGLISKVLRARSVFERELGRDAILAARMVCESPDLLETSGELVVSRLDAALSDSPRRGLALRGGVEAASLTLGAIALFVWGWENVGALQRSGGYALLGLLVLLAIAYRVRSALLSIRRNMSFVYEVPPYARRRFAVVPYRAHLVDALQEIGTRPAVNALVRNLGRFDRYDVAHAAERLGQVESPLAVKALSAVVHVHDVWSKCAAASALGYHEGTEVQLAFLLLDQERWRSVGRRGGGWAKRGRRARTNALGRSPRRR
jgi:hypothetical protein